MSPDHLKPVRLARPPVKAAVVPGSLEAHFERELAERVARARAEGRAAGEREALERAAGSLERATERLDGAREEAARELASNAVQLAVEIARTLVRNEVESGRHALETIVRESLAAADVGRGDCVVHLNPLDAASLANVRFRAGTVIEADEAVARGDVHVSTPRGLLVREVREALRSIHERLLGELA